MMSEDTYVMWDYRVKAYIAKDPGETTLNLDEAYRYPRDVSVGFCYAINKDHKRDEVAYALAPECGGAPTFHLPPPENVFKEVEALRARVAELEAMLTPQPIETAPIDGRKIIGLYAGHHDYHRKGDVVACWYQPEFEAFISSCHQMTLAPGYKFEDGSQTSLHSPVIERISHWMPYPKVSEAEKGND